MFITVLKRNIDYNGINSAIVLEEIDSHVKTKHENSIIYIVVIIIMQKIITTGAYLAFYRVALTLHLYFFILFEKI